MARGWESKSVEDQIGAAEAERAMYRTPSLNAAERERRNRTQSLQLSRSRIVALLDASRSGRYRSQLERALEDLDARLAELEGRY